MKFEEVLPLIRAGRKVRRARWGPECSLRLGKEGAIQYNNGAVVALYSDTLLADDWEVIKEPFDHTKLKHGDKVYYIPDKRDALYVGPVPGRGSGRDYFFVLYDKTTNPIYTYNSECEFIE